MVYLPELCQGSDKFRNVVMTHDKSPGKFSDNQQVSHPGEIVRYLSEFDFRYNHRVELETDDTQRMDHALFGIGGKRLTYRTVDKADGADNTPTA